MFRRSAEKTDVILSASVAFDEGSLARQPPARPPVDAARLFDVKQVMGAAPQRSARVFSQGVGGLFADPLSLPPGSFRRGAGRVGRSQMFSRLALRFVFVS